MCSGVPSKGRMVRFPQRLISFCKKDTFQSALVDVKFKIERKTSRHSFIFLFPPVAINLLKINRAVRTRRAQRYQRQARPKIKKRGANMDQFDVIFLRVSQKDWYIDLESTLMCIF